MTLYYIMKNIIYSNTSLKGLEQGKQNVGVECFNRMFLKRNWRNIHPFSIPAYSNCRVAGGLEAIPGVIGREARYSLDRSPIHHRVTQRRTRQTTTHTLTLTPKDNLETPINLTCMYLVGGRKLE